MKRRDFMLAAGTAAGALMLPRMSFAAEARAMHEGLAPERAIHGEAKPEEARKLIEDGIPVAPLPFRTRERAN